MLYLVRHGKTAYNAERRLQGQLDIPLCYGGLLQAEELGLRLKKEGRSFGALYCSRLLRAKVTAGIIGRHLGLAPVAVEGLQEIFFGKFQGHTFAEVEELFPDEHADYLSDRANSKAHGGENPKQVFSRARAALFTLSEVRQLAAGEAAPDALVVCHGAVIAYLRAAAMGMGLDNITELIPKNAELIPLDSEALLRIRDITY